MWRALALVLTLAASGATSQPCRQALALGLDVSGSVDSREYRLQLDGLAAALSTADVRAALLATPGVPVHLAIYEWSAQGHQRKLIGWTPLQHEDDIDRIAARLRATMRQADAPPGTALGAAMRFGADLLAERPGCWRRTLDLSGDGKNNQTLHPRDVKATLADRNLTINALVVGADSPTTGDRRQVEIGELSSYFRAWVIMGADGFVETALGFDDFQAAMTRKLLRELEGIVLSAR